MINQIEYIRFVEENEHTDVYDILTADNEEDSKESGIIDELWEIHEVFCMEDAEDFVEEHELPGEAVEFEEEGEYGSNFFVQYDGVNALQSFDEVMQGHGKIIIFEGTYQGDNLHGDGDVVKPKKVIEIIELV